MGHGRPYHYARWTSEGRLLLGGGDRPPSSGQRRVAAFRAGVASVRGYFEQLYPALEHVRTDAWEGLFATTPDGLPYIGPHRRYPRHLFALGYGGNGMTFGFLASRLLIEQLSGSPSEDHELFAFGLRRAHPHRGNARRSRTRIRGGDYDAPGAASGGQVILDDLARGPHANGHPRGVAMSVLRRALELVTSSFHRLQGDEIEDGILDATAAFFR